MGKERMPSLRRATTVLPRCRLLLVGILVTLLVSAGLPGAVQLASASGINSDRKTIASLQGRIAAAGVQIQRLVVAYDRAETRMAAIRLGLAKAGRQLGAEEASRTRAARRLRQVAVNAYVTGGAGNQALA
ncbi:MAG: hypothetical protein ACYDBS_04770, partial [Acidimicrobiales bacterium]